MAKPPLSHFSPRFANKAWADNDGYTSYFYCPHSNETKKTSKGWKQWGRKRGLYTWSVESSLDKELETQAGPIYQKICTFNEVSKEERVIWSQFLLSQLVRTPTYMRYEKSACEMAGIKELPKHDRVGCRKCGDLKFVANRDWCLLLAHEDDYFIRSDNPVLQTGFIENHETCLYYPMTPKMCFVACSMRDGWDADSHSPNETLGYELRKGGAHLYNFYLSKAAGESLIISPKHDGEIAERIYGDTLGIYPQPPFSLHIVSDISELEKSKNSIRAIMGETDRCEYPEWNVNEISPFYQIKDRAGSA
nr:MULTISPECIES: DUF4238 domain-containing protein [Pseudomonas]